jgi:hypothetical protein
MADIKWLEDCPSQENQENHRYSLRYYPRSESVEYRI